MDFNFSENQETVRELARGILDKEVSPDRVKSIEGTTDWFDRALWATLAEAGLLGLAVDEEYGGMGFGPSELAMLLIELGRSVAPVPALATLAYAGLPIAELGTDAQKRDWLTPMAAGELVLTAALVDTQTDDGRPGTTAEREGDGWKLTGSKVAVPSVNIARAVLVPALVSAPSGDAIGLFLVDPSADGFVATGGASSTGEPLFFVEMDGVRVEDADVLGGSPIDGESGLATLERVRQLAVATTCAAQLGISEKALEITASYVSDREQFGTAIGTFQAVQHRAADAFIDLNAMRWTTWRAINRLADGGDAGTYVSVAKYWCADGGARIATSCQHLHGGMGVDVDYPIHRYFLWSKNLELRFGAATPTLVDLGREIADSARAAVSASASVAASREVK